MTIEEQTFYQLGGGSYLRPFLMFAEVSPRGYSRLLQRKMTDFGSDVAFGQVNLKLKEHYGINVPQNGIRTTTLHHASELKMLQDKRLGNIHGASRDCIISETDGSMVPIVKPKEKVKDKRKGKTVFYREARLTLAHEKGSKTPVFSATFDDVHKVGLHILHCVKKVGMNKETKIHCVGDGASWISDQIENQFGAKANYLIDFYHLCEYLSAAASRCAPNNEKNWMDEQKSRLKNNDVSLVLLALLPHIEPQETTDQDAPVRTCHRYITNRLHQLDYKTAIDNDLPIGSGEIESAHRYIIQKRLKLPGSWWLENNAENMLALRVSRANNEWDEYWMQKVA